MGLGRLPLLVKGTKAVSSLNRNTRLQIFGLSIKRWFGEELLSGPVNYETKR